MRAFRDAVHRHDVLYRAAGESGSGASLLWDALARHGEPEPGSFGAAVVDTAPAEHAPFVASSEVAAAFAFGCLWRAMPTQARVTPRELRDAARKGWEAFAERATATEDLARGFGWSGEEAWTVLQDVDVRQGRMNDVQRVAKLAGRMYAAMRGAKSSRVAGLPEEVYDVEQGDNLGRLLPSEMVQLFDPELEIPTFQRLVERQTLQYAMRGEGEAGKGPLVLALDESGSMHAQRREWSKAAAVALMRVAFEEKREVAVVHYSTSTVVRQIKPGDSKGVVDMIRHFLDGGTAIGRALAVSVETVREMAKRGQHGADIVLVTDGIDGDTYAQDRALDDAATLGARLWTVAIECTIDATQPLRKRATHYIELGDAQMNDAKSAVALSGV